MPLIKQNPGRHAGASRKQIGAWTKHPQMWGHVPEYQPKGTPFSNAERMSGTIARVRAKLPAPGGKASNG